MGLADPKGCSPDSAEPLESRVGTPGPGCASLTLTSGRGLGYCHVGGDRAITSLQEHAHSSAPWPAARPDAWRDCGQ